MAIGISYTGHDGRRADFTAEGNPAPGSELDRIVRGADAGAGEMRRVMTPLADAMRRARRPQGPDPRIDKAAGTVKLDPADHRPGTLADKVDVGGSIEASQSGMRLKGDGEPKADGLYAKKNGRRGFFSLDEIDDPNAKGGIVGEQDAANRFAASNKESGGDGAFSENMQSRTEAEVNEETGEVTFWEYTKRWDVTNGRRVGGVSGETKRKICSFFLGGGDRQITYWRHRVLFSVVRSHYTDENGKTQYEFWMRVPKWGVRSKDEGVVRSHSSLYYSEYDSGSYWYSGAYGFGDYGHYPKRPQDRPRKLVFDDGREALVDTFEERSMDTLTDSTCNCWTYIGSSADKSMLGEACNDGNITLYGARAFYLVPFKNKYVEEAVHTIYGGDKYVVSAHWSYELKERDIAVATTKPYDQRELLKFLVSHGALVASAHRNEDYDTASYDVIWYNRSGSETSRNRDIDVEFDGGIGEFAPINYLTDAPFDEDDGWFYNFDEMEYLGYDGNPTSYFPFFIDTWARKGIDYNFPEHTLPGYNSEVYDSEFWDDYPWFSSRDGYWTHVAQPVCKIENWEIVDDMSQSFAGESAVGVRAIKIGNYLYAAIENAKGDVLEVDMTPYGRQFYSRELGDGGSSALSEFVLKNDLVVVKGR